MSAVFNMSRTYVRSACVNVIAVYDLRPKTCFLSSEKRPHRDIFIHLRMNGFEYIASWKSLRFYVQNPTVCSDETPACLPVIVGYFPKTL